MNLLSSGMYCSMFNIVMKYNKGIFVSAIEFITRLLANATLKKYIIDDYMSHLCYDCFNFRNNETRKIHTVLHSYSSMLRL